MFSIQDIFINLKFEQKKKKIIGDIVEDTKFLNTKQGFKLQILQSFTFTDSLHNQTKVL